MEARLTRHGMVALGVMREFHRHMDAEDAERYLMGGSPEQEAATFEEHLLVCATCRAAIADADIYLSSMNEAAGELRCRTAARIEHHWQLSKVLPAVGAVACALLLGILALWYYGPRPR